MEYLPGVKDCLPAVGATGIGVHVAKGVPDLIDVHDIPAHRVAKHIDRHRIEGHAKDARKGQQMDGGNLEIGADIQRLRAGIIRKRDHLAGATEVRAIIRLMEGQQVEPIDREEGRLAPSLDQPVEVNPDRQSLSRQKMRRRAMARVIDSGSHEMAGRHHAISRVSAMTGRV